MSNSLPNIIYLHSHDTGRMVQPYGYAVSTPHLQRLAEEGVLFRQAFCAAPTCSPSRAALLTGQAAHSSGMLGLAHRGFRLTDPRQHLAHTLAAAGYTTALVGVQHVTTEPSETGYAERITTPTRQAADVAPAAATWLSQPRSQPFFLDIGFFETHREFPTPGLADDPRYVRPPAHLPDNSATRADWAAYCASARQLDQGIGIVLDALDANGLTHNTLVICTTDHGVAFPGAKCNLTDAGIGVMLILRGPADMLRGGRVCDALVSHIDLFPTVCDWLRIAHPAWLQGRSLLPVLAGETADVNDAVFAAVTYHAAYEPQRAVRTLRWKYIRRYGHQRTPVLPNCDDSPSKDVWLAHDWRGRGLDTEQIYDLIFDPGETRNLATDVTYTSVLTEMQVRLDNWMTATNDPLHHGPVPAPQGSKVNDPLGLSPREPTHVI